MDIKSKDNFRFIVLRIMSFLVLLAGVLGIAVACINFKDIKYYIKSLFITEDESIQQLDESQWVDYRDWGNESVYLYEIVKYAVTESESFRQESSLFSQGNIYPYENIYSKIRVYIDKLGLTDLLTKKEYRFFLVDKENTVIFSSWDILINIDYSNYNGINKIRNSINKDKNIQDNYNRYIYSDNDTIFTYMNQDVKLYIAVSDYYMVDISNIGKGSLLFAIFGIAFSLIGVILHARLSSKTTNDGRFGIKYFNIRLTAFLLAFFLVSGFIIIASIFFIWYEDTTIGSFETRTPEIWTYALAALYAGLTALTTTELGKGLYAAAQNARLLKQMKAELIANVSHDIKTPLTSIIGYINLLEHEDSLSKEAQYYIEVLKDKSERLKNIISDLFELSKSTSGNSDLDIKMIDLTTLILQTLADMEDAITQSGQTIKEDLPGRAVFIKADGKKIYRVFQNIIGNALKYSVTDEPITVICKLAGKKAVVEIQNTASYKMDFDEEEILTKYKRGKGSMPEEGIGLGLSIADSFVKECGGEFGIKIEGDQFKVILEFKIV